MVIGIIGAGISGLTAGRILAKAGHDVTILEKSRGYGGRMATRYAGKDLKTELDHGLSYFQAISPDFQQFTAELIENGVVQRWGDSFALFDGETFYDTNPNPTPAAAFTAVDGMNSIGKYLSRWVDVRTETKVGGLTYIGANRTKKRSWMINLSAGNTFEADAVIIATPAPQAYGILQTSTDETSALKIIREIDEVHYSPCLTLLAGYGDREIPDWNGVVCKNTGLQFISNEATKKESGQECSFVVQATPGFTRQLRKMDDDVQRKEMLRELSNVLGGWATAPEWSQVHFWRYSRAMKSIPRDFHEMDYEDAPLALVGDYFKGNTVDHAYQSGLKLANEWVSKYPV